MLHRAPPLARRLAAQGYRACPRRGEASASVAEGFVESAGLVSGEARALAEYAVKKGIHAPKCRISAFPNAGYGIQAAEDVETGDTVLRVPPALWRPFSADQAVRIAQERAPDFVQRVEALASTILEQDPRAAAQLVPSTLLAVHTLFLASDRSGDWHAFTDFLPRHVDVPLHWQPEEVELLRGTDAHHQLAKRRSFVGALHRHLFEDAGEEKGAAPGIKLAQFAWAQSVLLSRATSGAERPMTLLPVIDCLNHSYEPNARILFDDDAKEFAVEALQPIAGGEEVVVSYGDLDSSTLLRQYGFLLDSNPHARVNAIPVFLPGQASDQCTTDVLDPDAEDSTVTRRKRDLLAQHGCGPGAKLPISRASGVDGALRDVLTILCLTEQDLEVTASSHPPLRTHASTEPPSAPCALWFRTETLLRRPSWPPSAGPPCSTTFTRARWRRWACGCESTQRRLRCVMALLIPAARRTKQCGPRSVLCGGRRT